MKLIDIRFITRELYFIYPTKERRVDDDAFLNQQNGGGQRIFTVYHKFMI